MKTIPICPHCNTEVTEINEIQTWTHKLERVSEQFQERGEQPYILVPDPKGELRYIDTNEGKNYTCAKCGGSLDKHYGVMGCMSWFEGEKTK